MATSLTPAVFYASITLIAFIYCSLIVTGWELYKFFASVNFNESFFRIRQPILNMSYIGAFLFVLYVLNPLTLLLSNVLDLGSQIPLLVNDVADILIFLSFFPRAWIMVFDRQFVDDLKNWIWQRELNPQHESFIIKYRHLLRSSHVIILTAYLLLVAPIFTILHILPYYNLIPLYSHILRIVFLIILLIATLYIVTRISIVSDEWNIRSELLYSIKTTGAFYTASHAIYIIIILSTNNEKWGLLAELLFVCIADLFVVYYSCCWTRKRYIFLQKLKMMQEIKLTNRRSSFSGFLTYPIQFQDIMDHREGITAFCNHLAAEFGLESILFLIEITQFKAVIRRLSGNTLDDNVPSLCDWHVARKRNKAATQTLYDKHHNHVFSAATIFNIPWLPVDPRMNSLPPFQIALHLYDKYVEDSADLCINISFQNRRQIYRYFQEISQQQNDSVHHIELSLNNSNNNSSQTIKSQLALYKVFDDAFIEIWRLIESDSFLRFKSTAEFRRLVSVLFPKEAFKANKHLIQVVDEALIDERKRAIQRQIDIEASVNQRASPLPISVASDSHIEIQSIGKNRTIGIIHAAHGVNDIASSSHSTLAPLPQTSHAIATMNETEMNTGPDINHQKTKPRLSQYHSVPSQLMPPRTSQYRWSDLGNGIIKQAALKLKRADSMPLSLLGLQRVHSVSMDRIDQDLQMPFHELDDKNDIKSDKQ